MTKTTITICLLAIAGGIFSVTVCGVNPTNLMAPLLGVIVGQTATALGTNRRMVNLLSIIVILMFLFVLPYAQSHPKEVTNVIKNATATFLKWFRQPQKRLLGAKQRCHAKEKIRWESRI